MKFRNNRKMNPNARTINITDFLGDTLQVQLNDNDAGNKGAKQALWFKVNDSTVVMVKRNKALALAWAIIDELNPSVL